MSDTGVQIAAVTFPSDSVIQIQYSEERESSKAAAIMRSIVIDTEFLVENELEELVEALQDIIDKGLLMIRNPPQVKVEPVDDD